MYGTIKLYKAEKGFGFIRHADGDDTFFHVSDFPPGIEPEVGLAVEFQIGKRRGKELALNIKPLAAACAVLGGGGDGH